MHGKHSRKHAPLRGALRNLDVYSNGLRVLMALVVVAAVFVALMAPGLSASKDDLSNAGVELSASTHAEAEGAADVKAKAGESDGVQDTAADAPDDKAARDHTVDDADATKSPSTSEASSTSTQVETATDSADMPAQSFTREFKNKRDEITLVVTVDAPEGALPADSTMKAKLVKAADVQDAVDTAVAEKTQDEVSAVQAVDVAFYGADGETIDPASDIAVTVASPQIAESDESFVVSVPSEGEPAVVDQLTDEQLEQRDQTLKDDELAFDADASATYAIAYTISTKVLTADGERFAITVTYDDAAGIPEGATLEASEIPADSQEYQDCFSGALTALEDRDASISAARFFDVQIVHEGEKVEPQAAVQVKIESQDSLVADQSDELCVVHFADDGTEVIDDLQANDDATNITYEQGSFSVIGTVATTNANGWPTRNGQYVLVLKSGSNYFAVAQDGTLKRVKYFNGTVTFVGEGTTDVSYLSDNDFLWYFTASGAARGYISTDEGATGSGTFIDPNSETGLSTRRRQLRIQDGKLYSQASQTEYRTVTAAAGDGQKLAGVDLYSDEASSFFLAPLSGFTANDNETDMFSLVDVEAMVQMWKERMNQKLTVNKTAEAYDYDNRIYQVDLEASSGYNVADPALALEFVVDCSRSMYFPAKLNQVGSFNTTTSTTDSTEAQGIRNWITANGDENQVYYFITDPNSAADVYAIWHDEKGWCFGNASYYHTQDSTVLGMRGGIYGHLYNKAYYTPDPYQNSSLGDGRHPDDLTVLNGRQFDGKIYTSDPRIEGQPWNRLDYLKLAVEAAAQVVYAVNPDTQIGLVKFAADAEDLGTYDNAHAEGFYQALSGISVIGGTDPRDGLDVATDKYQNSTDKNRQQAVVLVTDGAPNQCTWDQARASATALKGLYSGGKYTDLYTLGLSLANVGTNKDELFTLATGEGYRYDAESGDQIVDCVTQIIENMLYQANLKGDVVDVVDDAFYPVNPETGRPLEDGAWVKANGEVADAGSEDAIGQVKWDDTAKKWKVEWNDQRIDWPTTDQSGETIVDPGWKGRVYVKAKEDFLGGNGITTNAAGTQVKPETYINYQGRETALPDDADDPVSPETPAVNVDELALTEHSTEWTVALGASVDPLAELKALWNNIMVKEVVSKSDGNGVLASDGQMTYRIAPQSLEDGRAETAGREEFALSSVVSLSNANWNTLISRGYIEANYTHYGHAGVGTIRVELTQNVASGESNLRPSPHNTAVVGDKVEEYTLKVTYVPSDSPVANYHTGTHGTGRPGNDADEMTSTNKHVINVFAKNLQIQKVDMQMQPITSDAAHFQLYVEDENGQPVAGLDGTYSPVGDELVANQTVGGTGAWTQPSANLAVGTYWLVETHTPAGYNTITPVQVQVLAGEDKYTKVLPNATDGDKPIGHNWEQSGAINISDTTYAVRVGAEPGAGSAYNTDSTEQFQVKNPAGKPLPNTGGPGTALVYVLGMLMVIAAGGLLARRGWKRS